MFNITAYTPLESLLLFQSLISHGVDPSAFSRVSALLKDNIYIKAEGTYDAGRLTPESLQELFLHLLRDELKFEVENSDKSDGILSPNKRRKLQAPSLHTIQDARAHVARVPVLLEKLYQRYKEDQIRQIRQDEDRIERLQREIEELEKAGGDLPHVITPRIDKRAQGPVKDGRPVVVNRAPPNEGDGAPLPNGTGLQATKPDAATPKATAATDTIGVAGPVPPAAAAGPATATVQPPPPSSPQVLQVRQPSIPPRQPTSAGPIRSPAIASTGHPPRTLWAAAGGTPTSGRLSPRPPFTPTVQVTQAPVQTVPAQAHAPVPPRVPSPAAGAQTAPPRRQPSPLAENLAASAAPTPLASGAQLSALPRRPSPVVTAPTSPALPPPPTLPQDSPSINHTPPPPAPHLRPGVAPPSQFGQSATEVSKGHEGARPPNGTGASPVLQRPAAQGVPVFSPRTTPSPQPPHSPQIPHPQQVLQRPESAAKAKQPQHSAPPTGTPLKWEPPYQPQQPATPSPRPVAVVPHAGHQTHPKLLVQPQRNQQQPRVQVQTQAQAQGQGQAHIQPQPDQGQTPPATGQGQTHAQGQAQPPPPLQYPAAQAPPPRQVKSQPPPRVSSQAVPQQHQPVQQQPGLLPPQTAGQGQLQAPAIQAPPARSPIPGTGLQQPQQLPQQQQQPPLGHPGTPPTSTQAVFSPPAPSQPQPQLPPHTLPPSAGQRPPTGTSTPTPPPSRQIKPSPQQSQAATPPSLISSQHPQPQQQLQPAAAPYQHVPSQQPHAPLSQPQNQLLLQPQPQAQSQQKPKQQRQPQQPGQPQPNHLQQTPKSFQQQVQQQQPLQQQTASAGYAFPTKPDPSGFGPMSPSPVPSQVPPVVDGQRPYSSPYSSGIGTSSNAKSPGPAVPERPVPSRVSTPKAGPGARRFPAIPQTPVNTGSIAGPLGFVLGPGSATKWKNIDPTPSTPRSAALADVTTLTVEPLSPVEAEVPDIPVKTPDPPEDEVPAQQPSVEATSRQTQIKAHTKGRQAQKVDAPPTPQPRGRPPRSKVRDGHYSPPATRTNPDPGPEAEIEPERRLQRKQSSPDELQAEPESAKVKREEETPRPIEETGDTTADESGPSRPQLITPSSVSSRRGKRKRADSPAAELAPTPDPVPDPAPAPNSAPATLPAAASHSASIPTLTPDVSSGPPSHVLWTRGFPRISASALDQIGSHRHANMFANQIRDRDAPGYKNIVLGPMDLKSIRAAISHGNKSAAQAAANLPDGDPGTSSVWLPISEDLVPPRGIINSSQLDRELVHMFANAIMYNPDPHRGPGPSFLRRTAEDADEDDAADEGDTSMVTTGGGGGLAASVLGYKVDENAVVNHTLSMFLEVEKLLSNIQAAETERGHPPPPPGATGLIAAGSERADHPTESIGSQPPSASANVGAAAGVNLNPKRAEDEGNDKAAPTETETATAAPTSIPAASVSGSGSHTGTTKRRRIARG